MKRIIHLMAASLLSLFFISGCGGGEDGKNPQAYLKPFVSDEGRNISFDNSSPSVSRIKSIEIKKGSAKISAKVPARVVATISKSISNSEKIILFDSQDVTSLFTSFKQSRANLEKSENNLSRIKEMYENKMATQKDLNEAENDLRINQSSLLEMEARLRLLGYNPIDLEKAAPNSAWLIADVPESQVNEVQKGESVDLVFTSFSDKIFLGRAESIGETIDPVTRSLKVRITVSNSMKLLPGMYATADFGDEVNSVVTLPASAVFTVEGKDYVFVENAPGKYERREVVLSNIGESNVIVLKGIESGEKVVVEGVMLLKGLSFGY